MYRFCFFADTLSIGTPCCSSWGTVASVVVAGCATGAACWASCCCCGCCCSDIGDSGRDAILVS